MGSADRKRIRRALGLLFGSRRGESQPRPEPACAFGLVVDERLRDLQADVGSNKRLLVVMLVAVIGALAGLVADLMGAI